MRLNPNILWIVVILGSFRGWAQMPVPGNYPDRYIPSVPVYEHASGITFTHPEDLGRLLTRKYLNGTEGFQSLELEYVKKSPAGTHIRYKQMMGGIPVFQSFVQVNADQDNRIYSVINALTQIGFPVQWEKETQPDYWMMTNKGLKGVITRIEENPKTKQPEHRFYLSGGSLIHAFPSRLYINQPDSMISGMVYLPNPIVSSNQNYGGKFVDNNDQNTKELSDARKPVRFPAYFENGKFKLKQGKITLRDIHIPAIEPVTPSDTFLNYTRDQSGFEDVNVHYHLYNYSDYLKKTGFAQLLDSIHVDTHGEGGDDNSFFDPAKYPYVLEFGTGNVDDAEDAQVVIHEFGHSLSVIAAPGTARGHERLSMEEGQADYLSMSYSLSLSPNKKHQVFSWDGHNEFWDGFVTNTDRKYKKLTGVTDLDRELWSTALMCIHDKLGKGKTDSIILSYYFQQGPETSMPQMARVILKMDSILFKGRHVAGIWQCFTDREILDTVPWFLVKATPIGLNDDIQISGTTSFAQGTGPVRIQLHHPLKWQNIHLYNELGQVVMVLPAEAETTIHPNQFARGMYYLRFTTADGVTLTAVKLIRI